MIAGCALVRSSPANAPDMAGMTIFPSGQRPLMPAVSGRTLTGQELRLAAEHGHVVVLNFWGSWCTVCRQEAPTLAVAARQLKPSGPVRRCRRGGQNGQREGLHAALRDGLPKPERPRRPYRC